MATLLLAGLSACSAFGGGAAPAGSASRASSVQAYGHRLSGEDCIPASDLVSHGPEGPERTYLRPLGNGVMGLGVRWMPPAQAPITGIRGTWHLAGRPPAVQTGQRRVVIFYSPHPDDETLSMAPLIIRAVAAGMRVIVVAMTDGRTSGAIHLINAHLTRLAQPVLTPSELAAARIAEMRKATAALGVAPRDLVLAHLDAPKSDCGALVTVGEAHDVMAMMSARYPGAIQVTMSYAAERNLDHLACGQALHELALSGAAHHAEWTISRLWWTLPGPPAHWVLPEGTVQRNVIYAAIKAYDLWDPAHLSYAIGATSVGAQFVAERIDPRARVE